MPASDGNNGNFQPVDDQASLCREDFFWFCVIDFHTVKDLIPALGANGLMVDDLVGLVNTAGC
jgi:hypothetical protein